MLEGHIFRELLTSDLKSTNLFALHEIFHGVTAPGFLFSAGFAFAIATQRKWEHAVSFTYGFFRRFSRAVILILIGYALHFPFLSLQKTIASAGTAQWNEFAFFDVLQCIGFSLLLMRILLFVLKRERLFIQIMIILLLSVVYLTPELWNLHIELPMFVSSAVNGLGGSPFPLFPYAGFMLAGTCVSWLFLRSTQSGREDKFILWLMVVGIGLISIGFLFDRIPFQTYSQYSFWTTSPNYFWIRLGILLLMLSGLWYAEDFFSKQNSSIAWMPNWLVMLGVESLFVYIAHLLILYGWVTNTEISLRHWFSGQLSVSGSLLAFLGVTILMIFSSFGWHYIKKRHPVLTSGIIWWMGFCIVWSFLFNPY
jgi:hypothetical protein